MVIDCHTHLLPDSVRLDRTKYFSKERVFGSLFSSPKARIASQDEIMAYMDESAIHRSIVFGFPWDDYDTASRNNDEIWDFHSRYPDRIIPFATFSVANPDSAILECSRTLAHGFAGIGELAMYDSGWGSNEFETLRPCLDLARNYKIPVMIHVNEPVGHNYPGKVFVDINSLFKTISDFQDVDIILAHFGGGFFVYSLMPEIGSKMNRVYVDTAAAPFLYDSKIFSIAVQCLGEDKVLFGSDFPLLAMGRYEKMLDKADIRGSLRARILGGNVKKLLERSR